MMMGVSSHTSPTEPFLPEFGVRAGVVLPNQLYLGGRFSFVGPVKYNSFGTLRTYNDFSLSGEMGYELKWWSVFSARFYGGLGLESNYRGFGTRGTTEWRPFISPGALLVVTPFSPISLGVDARLVLFGSTPQGWLTFMLGFKF